MPQHRYDEDPRLGHTADFAGQLTQTLDDLLTGIAHRRGDGSPASGE